MLGVDMKMAQLDNSVDIGANVVRAHERFPCGGRRSGH